MTAVAVPMPLVGGSAGAGATPLATATPATAAMDGVSCVPGQCVAAGDRGITTGATPLPSWTLTHGTWSLTPLPTSTTARIITDVSCAPSGACVAVGARNVGASFVGLAERLAAGVWQETPLPAGTPWLDSVSCTSATWCMAVGTSTTAATTTIGVAFQWNGATWSKRVTTAPISGDAGLNAVSCLSATPCMAVGYSDSTPLAESWNGTVWAITTPTYTVVPESYRELDSISCTSADFCLSVGWVYGCCGSGGGIAMTWNGRRGRACR